MGGPTGGFGGMSGIGTMGGAEPPSGGFMASLMSHMPSTSVNIEEDGEEDGEEEEEE